jgi:hypothetical protein
VNRWSAIAAQAYWPGQRSRRDVASRAVRRAESRTTSENATLVGWPAREPASTTCPRATVHGTRTRWTVAEQVRVDAPCTVATSRQLNRGPLRVALAERSRTVGRVDPAVVNDHDRVVGAVRAGAS